MNSNALGKAMPLDEQINELDKASYNFKQAYQEFNRNPRNFGQNKEDVDALCTGAVLCMLSKRYRDATEVCEKILGLDPVREILEKGLKDAASEKRLLENTFTYKAIALAGLDNLGPALSSFQMANALGTLALDKSERDYERADVGIELACEITKLHSKLKQNPEDPEPLCKSAAVVMLLRRYSDAIDACESVLGMVPLPKIRENEVTSAVLPEDGTFRKVLVLERTYVYEAIAFAGIDESSAALAAFATANRLGTLIRRNEP